MIIAIYFMSQGIKVKKYMGKLNLQGFHQEQEFTTHRRLRTIRFKNYAKARFEPSFTLCRVAGLKNPT